MQIKSFGLPSLNPSEKKYAILDPTTHQALKLGGVPEESVVAQPTTRTIVLNMLKSALLSVFGGGRGSTEISTPAAAHHVATPANVAGATELAGGSIKGIGLETIGRMEAFRGARNPELSTEEMVGFIKRGAELFEQIQAGGAPDRPNLKDILSVSWFCTASAMEGGQEVGKGSMRMQDPEGKIHAFLKGFKSDETSGGLPSSSVEPYRRFSSHYNGTSVTGEKMGGSDKQWGIESYESREVFPGGSKCLLWNEMSVPGSDKKEVFIKFEEAGFPIPTSENLAATFASPNLSLGQKIGSVFRDIGRCIAHCTNFAHGRGETGRVTDTVWKEHTATNKEIQGLYKDTLKGISKIPGIPNEIKAQAKTLLTELGDKQTFFGNMEGNIRDLADKIGSSSIPETDLSAIREGLNSAAEAICTKLQIFMLEKGHKDLGMTRKGNEVHINPFERATGSHLNTSLANPTGSDGQPFEIKFVTPPDNHNTDG